MPTERKRRKRRGCLVAFVLLLCLGVLLAIGVFTGVLVGPALSLGVQQSLNADFSAGKATVFPEVSVTDWRLGDGGEEFPLAMGKQLTLTYGAQGRYAEAITIEGLEICLDRRNLENTNADFLLEWLRRPPSQKESLDPLSFIPRRIQVSSLLLRLEQPDYVFRSAGLSVQAEIDRLVQMDVSVSAEPWQIGWRGPDGEMGREGQLELLVSRQNNAAEFSLNAALPELLACQGEGSMEEVAGGYDWNVDLSGFSLDGVLWDAAGATWLPVPVSFSEVRGQRLQATGTWRDATLRVPEANLLAEVDQLLVGPSESPYYSGSVALDMQGAWTETGALQGALRMGPEQQTVRLELSMPAAGQGAGKFAVEDWNQAQLVALTPTAYRAHWETLPALKALSADLSLTWTEREVRAESDLRPQWDDDALAVASPLNVSARVGWDETGASLALDSVKATLGDMLSASLSQGSLETDTLQGTGSAKLQADLSALGTLFGLDYAYGEVDLESDVAWSEDGAIDFKSLQVAAEGVGYDALSLPYGETLHMKGAGHADPVARLLSFDTLHVQCGEGTQGEISSLRIDASGDLPQVGLTQAQFTTDFGLISALGWLSDAQGAGRFSVTDLVWGGERLQGAAEADVTAQRLALEDDWAVAEDVEAAGGVQLADGLIGEATASAAKVVALGAALEAFSGQLVAEGWGLRMEDLQCKLFRGRVQGGGYVGILEDDLPIQFSGKITNASLASFTKEFQPPGVRLTGRVSGTLELALRQGTMEGFSVALRSLGGCTLNRDAVEQILLAQYAKDMGAGTKILKAVQKIIGEDEDRQFDSAELSLKLEGEDLVGQAVLESPSLRLSIDLRADPQTVTDAMMMRQMERIAIEGISGE
jgi:hypothetical protein